MNSTVPAKINRTEGKMRGRSRLLIRKQVSDQEREPSGPEINGSVLRYHSSLSFVCNSRKQKVGRRGGFVTVSMFV